MTGRGRTLAPVESGADVVIIGSGAGGAPTAALLAEAGHDVVVLEEGDWVAQGEVTPFSLSQMDRQYRGGGITVALGRPSIAYTEGRCAGGGTEINSGLYWRPPGNLLDRWRDQHDLGDLDPDELDSILDEVERELDVNFVPGETTAPSRLLAQGADRLGWQHDEVPRWMTYPDGELQHGRRQSMTETYLPRARRAGARILTGHRVHRITHKSGRAHSVVGTGPDGVPFEIRFDTVIVCAGAIQTPALLQRSGLHHNIGRRLAVHPTVKLTARFPDPVNVPDDVPVHQVKEFAPQLSFGGSASHPGLVALSLSDAWDRFKPKIVDWRNMSVYYAAITSEGHGRVRSLRGFSDPIVTYRLTARDRALLGRGLGRLSLMMLEAGADEVYPSFRDAPIVATRADIARQQHLFAAGHASVMTVHLCSTVPFGGPRDPRRGADPWGRVIGVDNVYVNDASLLPDAPGVNPQATVMALAIRNARVFEGPSASRGSPAGRGGGTGSGDVSTGGDVASAEIDVSAGQLPAAVPGPDADEWRPRPDFRAVSDVLVVTGGAGWLGRGLLDSLAGARREWAPSQLVRVLVAEEADRAAVQSVFPEADVVVGDVRIPESLDAVFAGCGGMIVDVVHAAGVIHPGSMGDFFAVNAEGTRNVLLAASRAGVRRVVHVSSNSPFGTNPHRDDRFRAQDAYDPYYGYGESKMLAELHVADAVEQGLDAVTVRPPWFYGPFQPARQTQFFSMIKSGRFPIIGDGEQRRSMTYIDHLVDGVLRATLADVPAGGAWWIADACPYTVNEIVVTVGDALRDEGYEVRPNRLHVPGIVGRLAEIADATVQRAGRYHQAIHVLGEMDKTIAVDISAARRDLGYDPQISLYEGMRRSIRWCHQEGIAL